MYTISVTIFIILILLCIFETVITTWKELDKKDSMIKKNIKELESLRQELEKIKNKDS